MPVFLHTQTVNQTAFIVR